MKPKNPFESIPVITKLPDFKPAQTSSYSVTYRAIEHESMRFLPAAVKARVRKLEQTLATSPKDTVEELQQLMASYPNVPVFWNFLYAAYSQIGKKGKAEETVLEMYQKFPDYLYARLAFGHILLENKELEKFAEVFDNKFDLQMLYPKRKLFHISEFVLFNGLMGLYYTETEQLDIARLLYKMLNYAAPNHPITKTLYSRIAAAQVVGSLSEALETAEGLMQREEREARKEARNTAKQARKQAKATKENSIKPEDPIPAEDSAHDETGN